MRSILEETIDMPKTSVLKAVRMPMTSENGQSLVMVQMDTQENEINVLEHKSGIKSSKLRSISLDHVGIRELNYEELWNKVQELTVVKRVVPSAPNTELSNEVLTNQSTTSTTMAPITNEEQYAEIIEKNVDISNDVSTFQKTNLNLQQEAIPKNYEKFSINCIFGC